MGDIADMMLDGILDASGEYTGRSPGHPVYPGGWFGDSKNTSWKKVSKVKNFLKQRGIEDAKTQKRVLTLYGNSVKNNRPTSHASNNWKKFKQFVDNYLKTNNNG